MRWEDERYVRLYTRDSVDWLMLSLEAQGLLALILRKLDRAGILPLGKHGGRAVAIAVGHPGRWELARSAGGVVRIERKISRGSAGIVSGPRRDEGSRPHEILCGSAAVER